MDITLPPRKGSQPYAIDSTALRHIVIIGANGSGKTRFANRLAADLGDKAFRLSALKALYTKDKDDTSPNSIDTLYNQSVAGASLLRPDLAGQFERTIGLLVNEEMLSLIEQKYSGNETAPHTTRLDHVMQQWQKVVPGNRVLIESGRMLFSRDISNDT